MKNKQIANTLKITAFSSLSVALLLILQYFGIIDEYNGRLLAISGIYAVVALGLNLITGFTGQLALGHAGFMCIGGYTTAIMIMRLHMPFPLAIIIGGIVAGVFGFIIGFPTLKLRGDYLAIATLGFGEMIRVLIVNTEPLTGGAAGLKGIPPLSATEDIMTDLLVSFAVIALVLIIVIAMVGNLIKSSHGRAIISVREDEIASSCMGVNISYQKVFAFVLSAFIAGVGGGLYAMYMGYLSPANFNFLQSVNIVIIVVLGGLGSITGTILSAVGFTFIQEWLREFKDLRLVIFGLLLIIVMLFLPKGLLGNKEWSVVKIWNAIIDIFKGKFPWKKPKEGAKS